MRMKKSTKKSKTPKNTSSYQKTINEQSLNQYLKTRNEIDSQYQEVTDISYQKNQSRLIGGGNRGSEQTGDSSMASPELKDLNTTAFSNKLSATGGNTSFSMNVVEQRTSTIGERKTTIGEETRGLFSMED